MERHRERRRRTGEQGARLGGRSERVVRDVLQATAAELARVGYAVLRVEDVAALAGVNKTTIYRRWPTKADLVSAALRSMHEIVEELPDTGSLRSDLLVMLKLLVARVSRPERQSLARVITAEMDLPEFVQIARTIRKEYQAPWRDLIARAVTRGELPEGSDAGVMIEMIISTVCTRILRLREPTDDDYMTAVVDLVVLGAKSGGAVRKTPPKT